MGAGLMTVLVSVSVTLVGLWTRVYTWGTSPTVAWERRAEIHDYDDLDQRLLFGALQEALEDVPAYVTAVNAWVFPR